MPLQVQTPCSSRTRNLGLIYLLNCNCDCGRSHGRGCCDYGYCHNRNVHCGCCGVKLCVCNLKMSLLCTWCDPLWLWCNYVAINLYKWVTQKKIYMNGYHNTIVVWCGLQFESMCTCKIGQVWVSLYQMQVK